MDRSEKAKGSSYKEMIASNTPFMGTISLISLTDDRDTVAISALDRENRKWNITVSNAISYRKTEERFMLSSIRDMNRDGVLDCFLVSVEESSLIPWIVEDSFRTIEEANLYHTRLSFTQDILDVITMGPIEIHYS